MKRLLCALSLLLATVRPGLAATAETNLMASLGAPGPFAVESLSLDWNDATRQRPVPVKIYLPKSGNGPFPVILFSHGLGGSREGYAYLGNHWASHGFVSVHLQHLGSDSGVLQGAEQPLAALKTSAANPTNAINRALDVRFALDQLTNLNADAGPLHGRLDLKHIGLAGHSFGAHTTLAVAGQGANLTGGRFADARVTAAIAMSPTPSPRPGTAPYVTLTIPVFHMTGTLDDSPIGNVTAAQRRIAFDRCAFSEQYLVTFTGADHMVFSGRGAQRADRTRDAQFQKLICASSTAFWNAHLKGDANCQHWLTEGGFAAALGADGVFEHKPAPAKPQ